MSDYYGSVLFGITNKKVLKIFKDLIDWYKTGQLLIPQILFDTISLVENLVCIGEFQYMKFFEKNQAKNDLNIGN